MGISSFLGGDEPQQVPVELAPRAGSEMLTDQEREQLRKACDIVDRTNRAFVAAGKALRGIRDGRLYRETHETFEDFAAERWDMSRRHANRLIAAADVVDLLGPMGLEQVSERLIRPLTGLSETLITAVWQECLKRSPKPTADLVRKVIAEMKPKRARRKVRKPRPRVFRASGARVVVELKSNDQDLLSILQDVVSQLQQEQRPKRAAA